MRQPALRSIQSLRFFERASLLDSLVSRHALVLCSLKLFTHCVADCDTPASLDTLQVLFFLFIGFPCLVIVTLVVVLVKLGESHAQHPRMGTDSLRMCIRTRTTFLTDNTMRSSLFCSLDSLHLYMDPACSCSALDNAFVFVLQRVVMTNNRSYMRERRSDVISQCGDNASDTSGGVDSFVLRFELGSLLFHGPVRSYV